MKKVILCLVIMAMLTGCSGTKQTQDSLLQLRQRLSVESCGFVSHIWADFGDSCFDFSLNCRFDTQGNMTFEVLQPERISGITGKIASGEGNLTFDDKVLGFSLLADGELSPVSGPWILMKALRSGYLSAWREEGQGILVSIDDNYGSADMELKVLFSKDMTPISAEILFDGRCIMTLRVENYCYL